MAVKMTIMPKGQIVDVKDGETILEAATGAGFSMPFNCRGGVCAACKGRILAGDITSGSYSPTALTSIERSQGYALFCCAIPKTDLIIESQELNIHLMQAQTLPSRVHAIEKVSHDVAILSLQLPVQAKFSFLAGQYIDILMKDEKKRSFSIANSPHDMRYLQLHIRHISGGEFSHYLFHEMKKKEMLRFVGPLGSFFLREESDKPIIFIASGTGFAPVKSIIEYAFHRGIQRQMIFYWGARTQHDLYLLHLPLAWQEHAHFTFIPVLSEATDEDWPGRQGLVHEAVLQDFQDLSGWQVYASGAPIMVEAAYTTFTARGLPNDDFFSDAFFSAKDLK